MVESYGAGRFLVSGTPHAGSILVFPEQTLAWPVHEIAGLPIDSLQAVQDAYVAKLTGFTFVDGFESGDTLAWSAVVP